MVEEFKLWIDYPPEFKKRFDHPPSNFHQQCNHALRSVAQNPSSLWENHIRPTGNNGECLHVFVGELNGPDKKLKDASATFKVEPTSLALKIQKLSEIYGLTPLDLLANAFPFYRPSDRKTFSQKPLSDVFKPKKELYDPKIIDQKLDGYRELCRKLDSPRTTADERVSSLVKPPVASAVATASEAEMYELVEKQRRLKTPGALAAERVLLQQDADRMVGQVEKLTKPSGEKERER